MATQTNTSDCKTISDAEKEQLTLLNCSLYYLLFFIASSLLSMRTLRIQRCELLQSINGTEHNPPLPNPLKGQITANLLSMAGMLYFVSITKQAWCTNTNPSDACERRDDYFGNLLILFVITVRFSYLTKKIIPEE